MSKCTNITMKKATRVGSFLLWYFTSTLLAFLLGSLNLIIGKSLFMLIWKQSNFKRTFNILLYQKIFFMQSFWNLFLTLKWD